MSDLVVIVPSRGRPHAAVELAQAFADTCTAQTRLVFAVDEDDLTQDAYFKALHPYPLTTLRIGAAPSTMVKALNETASEHVNGAHALGFLGDDHRPRSVGWDTAYLDALRELGTGIVYGDDLFQGERLPTQCAMTADIVRALGYMSPPSLHHLYVDTWWRALGLAAGCLRYLPDVVVEHMHPAHPEGAKGEWDPGYRRVNSDQMYRRDSFTFERLRRRDLPAAAEKVKALR